jgi:hypothetical protein
MATLRWRPAAPTTAQVDAYTIGVPSIGSTYSVSCNGKTFTYTAGSTVAATEAAAFVLAYNAAGVTELGEALAVAVGAVVSFTATTPGLPFTFSYAAGGVGSPTFTGSTTTAASSVNHWSAAGNWSTGAVPVTGDNVYIEDSIVPILYGLAQSGVTLASLNVAASFTGTIGLPETSAAGYLEYRQQYLQIGATLCNIGYGTGAGSGRIKLDNGSVQTTLNISGTGSPAEPNLESLQWKGTHAANVVNVSRGSVAAAGYGTDVATIATLTIGYQTSPASDVQFRGGPGLTLATLSMSGGQVDLSAGLTAVNKTAGTLALRAGNVTTITDDSGSTFYLGTGTVTTWNVGNQATADFSQDMRARSVGTLNLDSGATVNDPFGTVVASNPTIHLVRCRFKDVTMDFGPGRTIAVS